MKFNKEVFYLARKMKSLGISEEHRSYLIRENCNFLGNFFGYHGKLKKGLDEASEERFFGLGAYRFLKRYQRSYYVTENNNV